MKSLKNESRIKNWKKASVAGVGLSLIGLISAAMIIGQLLPPVLQGQAPDVSSFEMAIESTIAILFLMGGFALMVVGADPFEEISQDFSCDSVRDNDS